MNISCVEGLLTQLAEFLAITDRQFKTNRGCLAAEHHRDNLLF